MSKSKKNLFEYNSATLTGTYFKDWLWSGTLIFCLLSYVGVSAYKFSYLIKQKQNDDSNVVVEEEEEVNSIDNTVDNKNQTNNEDKIIEIKTTNEELSTFINNAPENYEIYEIIQIDNSEEVIIRYIKKENINEQTKGKTLKLNLYS